MKPLRSMRSIKLKIGSVIVAAIAATAAAMVGAREVGLPTPLAIAASTALALLVVQLLARGMTAPLREMAAASAAMAKGEHGQTVEVRGRDEVAQLAEAFNVMSHELAETDRMRRELVANAAHELRTPISALRASLDNLIDGVQPPDQAALEALGAQVARLGGMVEQLLDLSRLESQEAALDLAEFPVHRLLARARDDALLSVGPDAQARIEVESLPEDLRVVADEERFRQVVANLIDNAVRHSPPGERVSARATLSGSGVRVDVVDHGPGIPEAERPQVFERFYQAEGSRSDGGAGLGLAIAHSIVSMHHGTIWVEDAEPRGCRMVVELPLLEAESRNG
jgi:signal transduction histidine kinase